MSAFTSEHAIITTGKNLPLPRDQGLVRGECLPATTTVPGYLALLVHGHISCGGEFCFNSVHVVAGNFICTGIAYSFILFVLFCPCKNDGPHYVGCTVILSFFVFKSLAIGFAVTCAG